MEDNFVSKIEINSQITFLGDKSAFCESYSSIIRGNYCIKLGNLSLIDASGTFLLVNKTTWQHKILKFTLPIESL